MKKENLNNLGVVGAFGENIAAEYLLSLGYEIEGRNIVCDGNEIDMIVSDMRYIVFVEVKTRSRSKYKGISKFGGAAHAVNKDKQQRIISAAKAYLNDKAPRLIPRFDVIEVYVENTSSGLKTLKINHIPRAFGARR